MGNSFDMNQSIALAHVRSEQVKGWFLANAKMLIVLMSGTLLFLGVTLTAGNIELKPEWSTLYAIGAVAPVAAVAFFLAIIIEGGTILSAASIKEGRKNLEQRIALIERSKNAWTAQERQERIDKENKAMFWPYALMVMCIVFSTCGGEMFWHKLLEHQGAFFQVIGFLLGLVCSALLLYFEFKVELVERIVENSISSSALINTALDMSAKSEIHDQLFKTRKEKLRSPEFKLVIEQAAEQGLYGVLQQSLIMSGSSVSQEQLMSLVDERRSVRNAADAMLASEGQTDALVLPITGGLKRLNQGRSSDERKKVARLVQQFGPAVIASDIKKYADKSEMSEKTLKRWLEKDYKQQA